MIRSMDDIKIYIARQTTAYHVFAECPIMDVNCKYNYEIVELSSTPYNTSRVMCALCQNKLKGELNEQNGKC